MADVQNPTGVLPDVNKLPNDAVALIIWRKDHPQPMPVIVTRESFERNRHLVETKKMFMPETVYIFDSPTNEQGRKSVFQFSGVTSWVGNYHSGIVPGKV